MPAMNYRPARGLSDASHLLKPCSFSENSAQLEKPLAMAGVAHAAADEERAQRRLGKQTRSHIVRELAAGGHAVHFSELIGADGVDLLAQKRRKGEQVMQIS